MAIYNPRLAALDLGEVRRYAGLKGGDFAPALVAEAAEAAQFLAAPRAAYHIYEYDAATRTVGRCLDADYTNTLAAAGGTSDAATAAFKLDGENIARHLKNSTRAAIFAATIGGEIEAAITDSFAQGRYAYSLLLDAAATAAVEQIADAIEKEIGRLAAKAGFCPRWRFSPGYGDWPLAAQPKMLELAGAAKIGLDLTESLMLSPRKSVTAIIGLDPLSLTENVSCETSAIISPSMAGKTPDATGKTSANAETANGNFAIKTENVSRETSGDETKKAADCPAAGKKRHSCALCPQKNCLARREADIF